MAFANAELRLKAIHFDLILPWDVGAVGFFDAGRVWYDGDPTDADTIHTSYGGGIWFSILRRSPVSLSPRFRMISMLACSSAM